MARDTEDTLGYCPFMRRECGWTDGGAQRQGCIFARARQTCLLLEAVEMIHRLAEPLDAELMEGGGGQPILYTVPVSVVEKPKEARLGVCADCGEEIDRRACAHIRENGFASIYCDSCFERARRG